MCVRLGFRESYNFAAIELVREDLDDLTNRVSAEHQLIEAGGPAAEGARISVVVGQDWDSQLALRRDPQQPHSDFQEHSALLGGYSDEQRRRHAVPDTIR